jgi:alpha-L-fucosidase
MSKICSKLAATLVLCVCTLLSAARANGASERLTNRPERLEWFRDQGFGLFIHMSVDSQLGVVISHSLVGASDDYAHRFFSELPATFNPHKFDARDLATLAKLTGVRYVVFTAKHHSGFSMWDTATTDFNIMQTPFKRDMTAEILQAFRDQGIAPGLYFSPDDFLWLYKNGKTIERGIPEVQPLNNPGLMNYDLAQLRELMTKYGNIDVVFLDGQADKLRDLVWELQPNTVVTRGAMQTPEKTIPGQILSGAWEACITMGDGWQYQPMLENYKSAGDLIQMLIEIRAKGGNLLLNVGPKPDGELPMEQEERLREIGLWMFVNGKRFTESVPGPCRMKTGYGSRARKAPTRCTRFSHTRITGRWGNDVNLCCIPSVPAKKPRSRCSGRMIESWNIRPRFR